MGRRLPRALSPADIYKKLYVDDVDGKERSKKAKIYIDEIIAEALPENSPYKKPNRDALDDLAVRLADIFFWHPIFASTVPPSHDLLDAASAVVAPLREHIELIQPQLLTISAPSKPRSLLRFRICRSGSKVRPRQRLVGTGWHLQLSRRFGAQ